MHAESINNLLHQGKQLKQEGKIKKAVDMNLCCLKLNQNYVPAHFQLAEIYERSKEFDKAKTHYQRIVQLEPNNCKALAKLARLMTKQGDVQQAIATYKKALDQEKKLPKWLSVLIHLGMANALEQDNQLEKSIKACQKAFELKSEQPASVYCKLGDILYKKMRADLSISSKEILVDWQDIEANYRKAIELKPQSPTYHDKLGLVLVEQNKLDQAIKCFQKAIDIDSGLGLLYYQHLGTTLSLQGKSEQATYCYQKAVERYWGDTQFPQNSCRPKVKQVLSSNNHTGINKKLAFCFLTISGLNHELVWKNFFRGYEHLVNIYAHSKFEQDLGFLQTKQISNKIETTYLRYKMGAERELFKEALKCPENYKFIVLSESCIPLQLFSYVYQKLLAEDKSYVRMRATPSEYWRRNPGRVMGKLTLQECHKNSQWIILNRQHAQMIVEDDCLYQDVEKVIFLEEQYPATLLNLNNQVDHIQNQHTTFADFCRGAGGRPYSFSEITELDRMLLLTAKKKGLLFARKFALSANLELLYRETELAELLV